jgi:hypothetical protein
MSRPVYDPLLDPPSWLLGLCSEAAFPALGTDPGVLSNDPESFELGEFVISAPFQAILRLNPFPAPDVNDISWLDVPPPACQRTVPVPGESEENEVQQSNPNEFIE